MAETQARSQRGIPTLPSRVPASPADRHCNGIWYGGRSSSRAVEAGEAASQPRLKKGTTAMGSDSAPLREPGTIPGRYPGYPDDKLCLEVAVAMSRRHVVCRTRDGDGAAVRLDVVSNLRAQTRTTIDIVFQLRLRRLGC